MAGEIQVAAAAVGTHYAVVRDATGRAWNTAGTPAFEAINAANWGSYAISLARQSTTLVYEGDFPAVPAGTYTATAYLQAGGSPATTDVAVGSGKMEWSGTAEVSLAGRAAAGGAMTLDLAQALADVKTGTVGGALHAGWSLAFGKQTLDVSAKLLRMFGFNSQVTPLVTHDLDSGTAPTTRTPQ